MTDSLRDRQKQVARELILQAASEEIVEMGLEELSMQAVADRAGVSKRTLYNYFDSREALLTGIGDWSDQLTLDMGGYLIPEGLDALPDMVRAVWRTWKAQGAVFEAVLRITAATSDSSLSAGRRARHAALSAAVAEVRPELRPDQRDALASLLHALSSAPVYRRLTIEDGLDIDVATDTAAWGLAVIRDAIRHGNTPFPGCAPTSLPVPTPKEES